MRFLPLALFVLLSHESQTGVVVEAQEEVSDYGVDCSFPIHRNTDWKCDHLGDRKTFYENFMQGCRDYFGPKKGKVCDSNEADRLQMNLLQPKAMLNYTSTGFRKIRAPQQVMDLINTHWEMNKNAKEKEVWATGNIYVNHWESPTYMVSVENTALRGAGPALRNKIWEAVKPTVEGWTGMELRPTSQYGIRIYTEGAVLSPHVDRMPLISSCIINVAQDVDEPWPLEVVDREGKAVNVTMQPGDMVLYESHSLVHARPFPLKGRYMANIFIHFEPTGRPLSDTTNAYLETLDEFFPPYFIKDSPWAKKWARMNPNGWHRPAPSGPQTQTAPASAREAHVAASLNDVDTLSELAKNKPESLNKIDENGWYPLHETARSGYVEAAKALIEHGANKDARVGRLNDGQSVLNMALQFHGEDSAIVRYLRSVGAEDIPLDELEL